MPPYYRSELIALRRENDRLQEERLMRAQQLARPPLPVQQLPRPPTHTPGIWAK
jgi:hypothetical protein